MEKIKILTNVDFNISESAKIALIEKGCLYGKKCIFLAYSIIDRDLETGEWSVGQIAQFDVNRIHGQLFIIDKFLFASLSELDRWSLNGFQFDVYDGSFIISELNKDSFQKKNIISNLLSSINKLLVYFIIKTNVNKLAKAQLSKNVVYVPLTKSNIRIKLDEKADNTIKDTIERKKLRNAVVTFRRGSENNDEQRIWYGVVVEEDAAKKMKDAMIVKVDNYELFIGIDYLKNKNDVESQLNDSTLSIGSKGQIYLLEKKGAGVI